MKNLASLLDGYYQQNLDNKGLKEVLESKRSETFSDFFEKIYSSTEKDIALLLLFQLITDNEMIRKEIEKNTDLKCSSFQSVEAVYVFIEDILTSGATQCHPYVIHYDF